MIEYSVKTMTKTAWQFSLFSESRGRRKPVTGVPMFLTSESGIRKGFPDG